MSSMELRNQDIRKAVKESGVRMWQVAEEMHIHDSALSRKLRHELPATEKDKIMEIISRLAKER